jgi:hypothetical protein
MQTTEQLLNSWRDAADDLGIGVEEQDDAVLVPQFCSKTGMLCAMRPTPEGQRELQREAEAHGIGWSVLGASYLRYDRDHFIDMLNDWGWWGEGSPPPWYSGEPWTS